MLSAVKRLLAWPLERAKRGWLQSPSRLVYLRRVGLIASALTLAFTLGFWFSEWAPWQGSKPDTGHRAQAMRLPEPSNGSLFALPEAAQNAWFPKYSLWEALSDKQFNALLRILEQRIASKETLADFEREAGFYFDSFLSRIAAPKLMPKQIQKADGYFLRLSLEHPKHRPMIEQERQLFNTYAESNNFFRALAIPDIWFPGAKTLDTGGEPFADATIDKLIDILDAALSVPEGVFLNDSLAAARVQITRFVYRLRNGFLTDAQTAQIDAYLVQVKARFPEVSEFIDHSRYQVRNLLAGRPAPNIKGIDLDGVEFELNQYRGNIVVLYFSGHWCPPCRDEYPYQRFMLQLFKDKPVTILGINSDDDIGTIREAKGREGLAYRVWWDGHGEESTKGPIAAAWNVTSWPSVYILDDRGVIRFVQKRRAEAISAVNQLLNEDTPVPVR